jgi:hypothetical protein
VPPWLFRVGVLLWDGSYLLSSLADIISDVLVVWQWRQLGMHGHFAVGVGVFVSTSVWYTMLFLMMLFVTSSAAAPAASDSADGEGEGGEGRRRSSHGMPALQRLSSFIAEHVALDRVSVLLLFVVLLPFGQLFPLLVYGMLRATPPELIREYALRVLGGPAVIIIINYYYYYHYHYQSHTTPMAETGTS